MTDAKALYQARILELDENPKNEGRLEDATHSARCSNPLCGDRVQVDLRVEDGVVKEARFTGRGCALSRASASMLTVDVLGLTPEQAEAREGALEAWLSGEGEPPRSEAGIEALSGVRSFPSRIRCVTLPWEALRKALGEG